MTTPAEIVAEARTWIGTRYVHSAALKGVGCDCIGLIVGVGLALGVPEAAAFAADPAFKGYSQQPDPARLLLACETYLDRVPVYSMDLGDILLMRFEREPQHFGFVSGLDPLYAIHSYATARRVTEHNFDSAWRGRILRVYRFR